MRRHMRWALLILTAVVTAGAFRSEAAERRFTVNKQYCSFCSVADPFGQPCFYYGQPCGGDPTCYCGFCGPDVACLQ